MRQILITPQLAMQLLETNTDNRSLRDSHVRTLAGAMRRGEWRADNGETIKLAGPSLDDPRVIRDGQHRLWAVAEADAPVEMLVVFNVPREAMSSIDTGLKRGYADHLRLQGEHNANVLAAAVRLLSVYRDWVASGNGSQPDFTASRLYTPPQLDGVLRIHPSLRASTSVVAYAGRLRANPTAMVCHHYLFGLVNPDVRDEFYNRLIHGTDLGPDHPVRALRERLQTQKKGSPYSLKAQCMMFVMTWNAYASGRPLRRLLVTFDRGYPSVWGLDATAMVTP